MGDFLMIRANSVAHADDYDSDNEDPKKKNFATTGKDLLYKGMNSPKTMVEEQIPEFIKSPDSKISKGRKSAWGLPHLKKKGESS